MELHHCPKLTIVYVTYARILSAERGRGRGGACGGRPARRYRGGGGVAVLTPPEFVIVVRSAPSPVPVYCRLRRALKMLLRAYGFRAVDVREAVPDAARCPETSANQQSGLRGTPRNALHEKRRNIRKTHRLGRAAASASNQARAETPCSPKPRRVMMLTKRPFDNDAYSMYN